MDIHQIIGSLILSICECNISKERVKDHIIRLLGGVSRQNVEDLKDECQYVKEKYDSVVSNNTLIKSENQKLRNQINELNEELDKIKFEYETLKNKIDNEVNQEY